MFVCFFFILYCAPMLGQEINGIVMAKEGGNPVSGAYVTLFSETVDIVVIYFPQAC